MAVLAITICHAEPEIVAYGIVRFMRTAGYLPDHHVLLDNCWPIDRAKTHLALRDLANGFGLRFLSVQKNLGGHGGVTHVLSELKPLSDDLILVYDPDSNPVTNGWLESLVEVMEADRTLGFVSLMGDWFMQNRPWSLEMIAGRRVAFHAMPEMFNVTLFRGSVLKEGLKGMRPFYGFVEHAMNEKLTELNLRRAYLFDYRETPNPIPPPKSYSDWKVAHANGSFLGNFDEYLK